MNNTTRKQIRDSVTPLLSSRSPHVVLQAAMVLCSLDGIWCSDMGMGFTPSKVAAQIGLAKQSVFERLEEKRAKRKGANRRAYLRRKLKALQAAEAHVQEVQDNYGKEEASE